MNVEFRYVYRVFLQGRFSKLQRTLFVQNSTLRTNETGRKWPLNCRGVWLSPVIVFRYISLQCPATSCQHTWGPLALIPLLYSQNDLVKSFTVFVTDFGSIFWEKIQVGLQKLDFQSRIASHRFVRSQQVLHNILIVHCFVISQEVLSNPLRRQPRIPFSLIQVFVELFVLQQFVYLWFYKYPVLDFYVTHVWEIIPQIIEIKAGFIRTFDKVFHEDQFYVERGRKIFFGKSNRKTDDIILPWRQWCSFRPQFIYTVNLLVSVVPLTRETAVFYITYLRSQ